MSENGRLCRLGKAVHTDYQLRADSDLEECLRTMEEHQIRRVPVLDAKGSCCGMVAQADIARSAPALKTAEVVREVSQPH